MPRLLYLTAMLLMSVGTIFVLVTKEPEEQTIVSDDNFVYLIGKFFQSDEVSIATVPTPAAAEFTAVLPPVYQLYPSSKLLTSPAILYFHYDAKIVYPASLAIGYYDQSFSMWRPVSTDVSIPNQSASAAIDHFGKWSLLQLDDVARPNFDSQIESLIAAAPDEAVGYSLEIGYADAPGDFVILAGAGKSGGCGGQYKTGSSTRMMSTSQIFSDHLEYQVVVVWQLSDGCLERQSIE